MISCKLCSSKTYEISHPKFGVYDVCQLCDFISKQSKWIISEEEEKSIYDTHQNSLEDPRYVDYFRKFLNCAVLKHIEKDSVVLDFGSGPSPVLAQLLERDYHLKVDIYDYYYSPTKVYESKQYDLITSTEVVEHFLSPLDYFELFVAHLKPGGVLAIMTQFHPCDDQLFLKWHYIRDLSHIAFYTVTTMIHIAKRVGLEMIYTDHKRYITFKKVV